MLTGVNLAGAEFGEIGGEIGKHYRYPQADEVAAVAARGFTAVRVPFRWERLQPTLLADFDGAERERLDGVVSLAAAHSLAVIIDPHNYARWNDHLIGSSAAPVAAFADFWRRLAERYGARDGVIFGLMNEPHDMRTEDWVIAAQAAVDAIRGTGSCNRILLPGNGWTGAHSWLSDEYGTPNAVAMPTVKDPVGRTTFEFHQYLDADWSGRAKTCRPPTEAVAALRVATDWLQATNATGFLGEIGAGDHPQCLAGLRAMLDHVSEHPQVWRGWTAWAAGAWWPEDYPLLLREKDGIATPQLRVFAEKRAPDDAEFARATCARPPESTDR